VTTAEVKKIAAAAGMPWRVYCQLNAVFPTDQPTPYTGKV
jgi:hypothetical protein